MCKPHPMELRQRVVSHVYAGNTHRSAAARFDVSVKFVNDMVKLKQETAQYTTHGIMPPLFGFDSDRFGQVCRQA